MTRKYLVTVSLLAATAVLGCVMAWLRVEELYNKFGGDNNAMCPEKT